MTIKEQIQLYLEPLPSEWKEKLTLLLCQISEANAVPNCESVKACETVTSLSDFSVSGTEVSITYTDEKGIGQTRAFNAEQLLNQQLDNITPACLASQSDWNTLTFSQRLQLLIDKQCECCEDGGGIS